LEITDDRTVVGTANPNGDGPQGYAVHFAARFDQPFDGSGGWETRGAEPKHGAASVEGNGAGAFVSFDPREQGRAVTVKVGISFVSRENAVENLEAELPGDDFDFDALRARTRAAWNDALGAVRVEGGTDADRVSFTTALYHAQQHPNVFNDADGSYLGHDGRVHRIGAPGDPMLAGSTYYANFSLWDTYRAQMPLLALIAPERYKDMMRSLAAAM
jgi:putative alpha-1,2-mannosidase